MVYIAIDLLKGFLSEQCSMQCDQLPIEDLSSQRPFYSKPPAVPFHPLLRQPEEQFLRDEAAKRGDTGI